MVPEKTVTKEPVVFQVGDCFIGGGFAEYPTALMLSTFHQGDATVTDHKAGRFDEKRLRRYLERAIKLGETTGNPLILDVLAETPAAMTRYLEFLAEAAPKTPFLIDSSSSEAKLAGLKHVEETGRAELAIYDSISHLSTDEELEAIHSSRVQAAILLAHNPLNLDPKGRLDVLEGSSRKEGLLSKAKRAGITKPLVDTVALDLAGLSLATAAMPLIKRGLGLPVGAGSANSVALWKRSKQISPAAKRYVAPALCTYLQCAGADYILPGALRHAPRFFSTTAVTDALLAFAPPKGPYPPPPPKTRQHPRYTTL
jgi:tetrahydromethanopterin S-methyltransferase subunit H